jgi:hypothetical protein
MPAADQRAGASTLNRRLECGAQLLVLYEWTLKRGILQMLALVAQAVDPLMRRVIRAHTQIGFVIGLYPTAATPS